MSLVTRWSSSWVKSRLALGRFESRVNWIKCIFKRWNGEYYLPAWEYVKIVLIFTVNDHGQLTYFILIIIIIWIMSQLNHWLNESWVELIQVIVGTLGSWISSFNNEFTERWDKLITQFWLMSWVMSQFESRLNSWVTYKSTGKNIFSQSLHLDVLELKRQRYCTL